MYLKSPLNYMGGKYKLLPEIIPLLKPNPRKFVDLFGGGFNVGINVNAEEIYYNDYLIFLPELLEYFRDNGFEQVHKEICDRLNELNMGEPNEEAYLYLRAEYNKNKNPRDFFILACTCFSNMIRFNKKIQFNMPFGNRTYNATVQENLKKFCTEMQRKNITFSSKHFANFDMSELNSEDLVYCDPPYILSTGVYNDSKSSAVTWGLREEKHLLEMLDSLNERGIPFALNNMALHKGGRHNLLINWGCKYNVHVLRSNYYNCNYQLSDKESKTMEVMVTNF